MNLAEHVAIALAARGLVTKSNVNRAAKVIEELTDPDYIPNGKPVTSVDSEIEPAPIEARCGVKTGNDVQSGPYFCGEPAIVGFRSGEGYACACAKHESALRALAARLKRK